MPRLPSIVCTNGIFAKYMARKIPYLLIALFASASRPVSELVVRYSRMAMDKGMRASVTLLTFDDEGACKLREV